MTNPVPAVPRPPGLRRGVSALAVALLACVVAWGVAAPAQAAGTEVAASQRLVVLQDDHVVRARPNRRAQAVERVAARRPLTGVRTVLPALGYSRSPGGQRWVHVLLPGRPNSHTGWIRAYRTRRTTTEWRLRLDLSARQVTAYHHGHARRRFAAVIGTPSTPTPTGRFFIEEALDLSSQVGGPFALATSARSEVLQEFEGGPGQIALHGRNGLSEALGSAASHGCVRLETEAITWLAQRIGGGVPLTIAP
jgi:hypothetical protein